MPLKLTLKPEERVIINGCVIRNASRRQTLTIENHADVIRGHDLLKEQDANTPVKRVYFLIQTIFVATELREEFTPQIQKQLAKLMPIFSSGHANNVMQAANFVSTGDYYKALRALSGLIKYEKELLNLAIHQDISPQTTILEQR